MPGRLEGKVAFITGVGRGQGRSHAGRSAEEGEDITATDICSEVRNRPYWMSSRADLDETIAMVEKFDRRMVAHVADVSDRRAVQAAIDDGVAQLGHLDIVLANAGICALGDFPPEAFFQAIDTLLVGVFNTVSCSYPHLREGASIIATGSVAALIPGATDGPSTRPGGRRYSHPQRSIAQYLPPLAPPPPPPGNRGDGP